MSNSSKGENPDVGKWGCIGAVLAAMIVALATITASAPNLVPFVKGLLTNPQSTALANAISVEDSTSVYLTTTAGFPAISQDTASPNFDTLCSATITRQEVAAWKTIGSTGVATVQAYLDRFNAKRPADAIGKFSRGDHIPGGVLVATNFLEGGLHWNQLPVVPVVYYMDWGLFETTNAYDAPNAGACLSIVP